MDPKFLLVLFLVTAEACTRTEYKRLVRWECPHGSGSYTLERKETTQYDDGNFFNTTDVTITCESNSPPLTCDLLPGDAADPQGVSLQTFTVDRCQPLSLSCLLAALNATSVQSVSIDGDVAPTEDMLAGLGQIQIRSLTFNGKDRSMAKTIPVSALTAIPNLTSFHMFYGVFSLPEPFSKPLPLESLSLPFGKISYLPPGAFRGLQQLKNLDLDVNSFGNLTEDILEGLSSLESLRVSWCGLTELPVLARVTPRLTSLSAKRNSLKTFPVLTGLVHLERISIEDNQIASLAPDALANLPALKNVEMERNRVSSLPPTVFQNSTNIDEIFLHGNRIRELPVDVFKGLSKLSFLTLSLNRLTSLPPGVFRDLSSLRILRLDNNRLSELSPELLLPLRALEYLYVEGNKLKELSDDLFQAQTNLEELHLYGNELQRVAPRALAGASSLRVLNLSRNHLTTVYNENPSSGKNRSTPYDGLVHLRELNLRNNPIPTEEWFPPGSRLARVSNI